MFYQLIKWVILSLSNVSMRPSINSFTLSLNQEKRERWGKEKRRKRKHRIQLRREQRCERGKAKLLSPSLFTSPASPSTFTSPNIAAYPIPPFIPNPQFTIQNPKFPIQFRETLRQSLAHHYSNFRTTAPDSAN
ncbi:hypothetical protein Dimus_026074 [Dionaea muscipula]